MSINQRSFLKIRFWNSLIECNGALSLKLFTLTGWFKIQSNLGENKEKFFEGTALNFFVWKENYEFSQKNLRLHLVDRKLIEFSTDRKLSCSNLNWSRPLNTKPLFSILPRGFNSWKVAHLINAMTWATTHRIAINRNAWSLLP